MKYRILVFLLFGVLFPFSVHAECDYQRKADLMKMASNVQASYSYDLNEIGVPIFTIEVSNVTPDIFITDNRDNSITFNSEKSFNYVDGDSIKYTIYSGDSNCYGQRLNVLYVNLPNYNRFVNFEECIKNPEFEYCKLWDNVHLSDDVFREKYAEYLKKIETAYVVNNESKSENYILYIVIGVFIIVVVLYFVIRRFRLR